LIDIDFHRAFGVWAAHAKRPVNQVAARFSVDESYQRHERGEISAAEFYASLRTSLGLLLTDAQFEEGWNAILIEEKRAVTELIADLHARLPTYVFSNANVTHQNFWNLHYAHVVAPFRHVFVSSDIGMRKPEPEAFLHVAREMGVAPERILFFDDLLSNVEGARAVGMQAVQVRSAEDVRDALAALPALDWPVTRA
jgi:putative hydrolase of the HAD superfamily